MKPERRARHRRRALTSSVGGQRSAGRCASAALPPLGRRQIRSGGHARVVRWPRAAPRSGSRGARAPGRALTRLRGARGLRALDCGRSSLVLPRSLRATVGSDGAAGSNQGHGRWRWRDVVVTLSLTSAKTASALAPKHHQLRRSSEAPRRVGVGRERGSAPRRRSRPGAPASTSNGPAGRRLARAPTSRKRCSRFFFSRQRSTTRASPRGSPRGAVLRGIG